MVIISLHKTESVHVEKEQREGRGGTYFRADSLEHKAGFVSLFGLGETLLLILGKVLFNVVLCG